MHDIIKRIFHGILLGIGIVITVSIAIALSELYSRNYRGSGGNIWKQYSENALVTINNSKRVIRDDKLVILGKLENGGQDSWTNISIEVELYDSNGEFIDECKGTVQTTLLPSSYENFKITCTSCNDIDKDSISRHEIKITDAYFRSIIDDT